MNHTLFHITAALLLGITSAQALPQSATQPTATFSTSAPLAPTTSQPSEMQGIQSAAATASYIITFASYVVAAILTVFTIISGTLGVIYRNHIKRLIDDFRSQKERAEHLNQQLTQKLTEFSDRFSAFLSDLDKRSLLAEEARNHLTILQNPEAPRDDLFPAITYLGQRGKRDHIPAILKAAFRFPDDNELVEQTIKAVQNLAKTARPEEYILGFSCEPRPSGA